MDKYLRKWRQAALDKHQYESAIFVGDKLLALTNNDDDAFWLAQVHFSNGNYTRALSLVSRHDLMTRNASCKYLAAHCYVKQKRFDDALDVLGDKNAVHLITTADSSRRKLRHLTGGLSSKQNGKLPSRVERADRSEEWAGRSERWADRSEGRADRNDERADRSEGLSDRSDGRVDRSDRRADRTEQSNSEESSRIKFEACMCYLRGVCHAKMNAFDRAKQCYIDAVRIDVQCFEAFDALMKNSLMSPAEEWAFLDSLNFDSIQPDPGDPPSTARDAAHFTRNLYTTRLSKYARPDDFGAAIDTLAAHYNLAHNPDILLAQAETLYAASRPRSALTLTSAILATDPYNLPTLPLHLACLHALADHRALFLLAHDLADTHPHSPTTWLAVGTYYLTTSRIPQARSYFSKASLLDPLCGFAWLGFAHTFAADAEHDQAVSAYATAARLFPSTHLPPLFLGMQQLALHNLPLARAYLTAAYALCPTDPALLNELGVLSYVEEAFDEAERSFSLALQLCAHAAAEPERETAIRANLAHALRRRGEYAAALVLFDDVLRAGGGEDAGVCTAKALVLLELDDTVGACVALHEALAICPLDGLAGELLGRVMGGLEEGDVAIGDVEEVEVDELLRERGRRPRRRRGMVDGGGAG